MLADSARPLQRSSTKRQLLRSLTCVFRNGEYNIEMLMRKLILPCLAVALTAPAVLPAADLRNSSIVLAEGSTKPQQKAAQMLSEEIEKRTQLRLKTVSSMPSDGPVIVLGLASRLKSSKLPGVASIPNGGPADGFTVITSATGSRPVVLIAGNDDRGVVFGAGYVLRNLRMSRQRLELADGLNVTTAPKIPVRGQQLGYRPKTNAYDAWSVPMWEQYIRDLAIFGTNTVELIPPRSDDADDSPHFPLPKIEMMAEMSRIADEYGLNVSIWYPAMDRDYSDPKTVDFALKEWAEVFKRLPRIDAIFTPGGDPGHTQPKYLLGLLEKEAAVLHRTHPKAEMWVSPQSFNQTWMDEFYALLDKQPTWLTGVVFGPQVRGSLVDFRARVPKKYPVRFYPDITHSIHAEYPVEDWDWAFATTEGREGVNPRPLAETAIFRMYRPYSQGFVTYSEGCNDDVNKFIWSALGWNPDAKVDDILRDFSRYFIGDNFADPFARGLMALEQNWKGPLIANSAVDTTLQQFQALERSATPQQKLNWRFQQAMYRAYYDAFVRSRLISETRQEELAMGVLTRAKHDGSLAVMTAAEAALDTDALTPAAREYRARVFEMAEALFQSIHMQLSVPRYGAIALGRGANLDAIDFALNNRLWLKNRFREIRAMDSETDRVAKIDEIVNWTNPGPGGYYDDLGDLTRQPHLVRGLSYDKDPDFLKSSFVSFGRPPETGARTSWYTTAETLFENPLQVRYTDLDSTAHYKVKVIYGGDMGRVPMKMVANGATEIHGFRPKDPSLAPLEFEIPPAVTQGGTLTLEWSHPVGLGGNGRGTQVAEIWLIRLPDAAAPAQLK